MKEELIMFQVKLLRKLKKSVSVDKWERALTKFAHTYSTSDGWELERFGYKSTKLGLRLRLLKNLLEAQFDGNIKFKAEINTKDAEELRMEPLGRDKLGNLYWYQVDGEASLRVYKDDPEEETWELVAQNKEELVTVLNQLRAGPTYVREDAEKSPPSPMEEEDSMQEFADVMRDTGPVPESNTTSVYNSDDESSNTTDRSRLKVSATSSKVASREVSPSRSFSKSPSRSVGGKPVSREETPDRSLDKKTNSAEKEPKKPSSEKVVKAESASDLKKENVDDEKMETEEIVSLLTIIIFHD